MHTIDTHGVCLAGSKVLSALLGLVIVTATGSATATTIIPAPPGASWFGESVANAGDLDGDGIDDLVISGILSQAGSTADTVWAYSVASGSFLWTSPTFPGSASITQYDRLLPVEDTTGDGIQEIAFGIPLSDPANTGAVVLMDGSSGLILGSIGAGAGNARLGTSLARVGDVTGDGVPELAAGAPGLDFVEVLDVSVPGTISTVSTIAGWPGFGTQLAGLHDIDGDGAGDLAILSQPSVGLLTFVSSSSGATLAVVPDTATRLAPLDHDYYGDGEPELLTVDDGSGIMTLYDSAGVVAPLVLSVEAGVGYGLSIAPDEDWNADGVSDLWVGVTGHSRVDLVSGATGIPLFNITGVPGENFGIVLASGDYDGDGFSNVAVGTSDPVGRVVVQP